MSKFENFLESLSLAELAHAYQAFPNPNHLKEYFNNLHEEPDNVTVGVDHGSGDEDITVLVVSLGDPGDGNSSAFADYMNDAIDSNDELLPEHVKRIADPDNIERMTQLSTRDGRNIGNAVIFDITVKKDLVLFYCITDAYNIVCLNLHEMHELFHPPKYILEDFPNNEDLDVTTYIENWYDNTAA